MSRFFVAAIPYVWTAIFVLAIVALFYKFCTVRVPNGSVVVKKRAERFGKNRYTSMAPGPTILFPFLHSVVCDILSKNPVSFPTTHGHRSMTTDDIRTTTKGGVTVVVKAEFTYAVTDVDAFMSDGYDPLVHPDTLATDRAEGILTEATKAVMYSKGDSKTTTVPRLLQQLNPSTKSTSLIDIRFKRIMYMAELDYFPTGHDASAKSE